MVDGRRKQTILQDMSKKYHMFFTFLNFLFIYFLSIEIYYESFFFKTNKQKTTNLVAFKKNQSINVERNPSLATSHLSLQAPFHSVLPQGFLMRIKGMVSFLK